MRVGGQSRGQGRGTDLLLINIDAGGLTAGTANGDMMVHWRRIREHAGHAGANRDRPQPAAVERHDGRVSAELIEVEQNVHRLGNAIAV